MDVLSNWAYLFEIQGKDIAGDLQLKVVSLSVLFIVDEFTKELKVNCKEKWLKD